MKQLYSILGRQLIFLILWFSFIRVLFVLSYHQKFVQFDFSQILYSFFIGLRFDLSVICFYFGLINLFFFIPFVQFYKNRFFIWFFASISALILIFIFFIQIIDIGYYEVIGRRLSFELSTITQEDRSSMFQLVLNEYLYYFITFIFLSILLFFLWYCLWKSIVYSAQGASRIHFLKLLGICFPIYLILIILGARGGIQEKPLLESDAFFSDDLILGHLALNAPFTFSKGLILQPIIPYQFVEQKIALENTKKILSTTENQEFIDKDYPLYRQRISNQTNTKRHNVFLIIIESYASQFIGSFNPENKRISPHLDKIANQGMLFSNFHANGARSVEGIASILLSLPAFPDFTYLESTLQQNTNSSLATILNKNGYRSYFINGNFYGSFGMHQLAKKNGFDEVLAKESFEDYQNISDSVWGIWDQYQYDRALKIADKQTQPFLITLFTTSSHEPYELPDPKFEIFNKDVKNYTHKNMLHYADWSLGQFFEQAKNKPWYKDSIFIITADHSYLGKNLFNRSHIPLILYTPDQSISPARISKIGSQIDILPTIIDFLDLNTPHGSAGKTLLKESQHNFAYFSSGQTTFYTEGQGYVFDKNKLLKKFTVQSNDTTTVKINTNNTADLFLSWFQTTHNAIISNKIIKK